MDFLRRFGRPGRTYANRTCPYCSARLEPPPRRDTDCRTCSRRIHVRLGPDRLTYLLQDIDLPVLDAAWAEHEEAEAAKAFADAKAARDADWSAYDRAQARAVAQIEASGHIDRPSDPPDERSPGVLAPIGDTEDRGVNGHENLVGHAPRVYPTPGASDTGDEDAAGLLELVERLRRR
jgi:hypothetical protein